MGKRITKEGGPSKGDVRQLRTYGETLKKLRGSLGQSKFATRLDVTQSTVSAWENNGQVPTNKALEKIRQELGGDADATQLIEHLEEQINSLREASGEARYTTGGIRSPHRTRVLTQKKYLDQQQEYLASVPDHYRKTLRVCLIGPESLPVMDSPEVQSRWVENLSNGMTYVILWFLCLVEPGSLRALAPKLDRIGEEVRRKASPHAGSIVHFGLQLLDGDDDKTRYKENEEAFRKLKDDNIEGNKFELANTADMTDLRRQFLRYYFAPASLVVYFHGSAKVDPLASVTLSNVRSSAGGDPQTAYFFLGPKESGLLTDLLDRFFQTVSYPTAERASSVRSTTGGEAKKRGSK